LFFTEVFGRVVEAIGEREVVQAVAVHMLLMIKHILR
jgi:hypothetical protein